MDTKNNLILTSIPANELVDAIATKVAEQLAQQPTPKETKEYLTRNEVAEKLNISLVTLHRYTVAGKLTSVKYGNRVVYATKDVQDFITKNEVKWKV